MAIILIVYYITRRKVFHYCGKLVRWPKREAPLLAKAPGKNEQFAEHLFLWAMISYLRVIRHVCHVLRSVREI